MTNKTKYTAEDFERARFAIKGDTSTACRSASGFWRTSSGLALEDSRMAANGWVPVREANGAAPITLEVLEGAWEQAEEGEYRKGDLLILPRSDGGYSVFKSDVSGHTTVARILQRAPRRPEGAEELEALLHCAEVNAGKDPTRIANWLAERGVRLVADDE